MKHVNLGAMGPEIAVVSNARCATKNPRLVFWKARLVLGVRVATLLCSLFAVAVLTSPEEHKLQVTGTRVVIRFLTPPVARSE